MPSIHIRTQQQQSRRIRAFARNAAIIIVGSFATWSGISLIESSAQKTRYERVQLLIHDADIKKAGTMIAQYEKDRTLPLERIAELREQHTRAIQNIEQQTLNDEQKKALCAAYGANDQESIERISKEIKSTGKISSNALVDLERRCSSMKEDDLITNIDLVVGETRLVLIEEFLKQHPNSAHVKELRDDAITTYVSVGRSYFREHVAPKEVIGYLGRLHRFIVIQHPNSAAERLEGLVKEGRAYAASDVPLDTPGTIPPQPKVSTRLSSIQANKALEEVRSEKERITYDLWQQAREKRAKGFNDNLVIPSPSLRAEIMQHLDAIEYAASKNH